VIDPSLRTRGPLTAPKFTLQLFLKLPFSKWSAKCSTNGEYSIHRCFHLPWEFKLSLSSTYRFHSEFITCSVMFIALGRLCQSTTAITLSLQCKSTWASTSKSKQLNTQSTVSISCWESSEDSQAWSGPLWAFVLEATSLSDKRQSSLIVSTPLTKTSSPLKSIQTTMIHPKAMMLSTKATTCSPKSSMSSTADKSINIYIVIISRPGSSPFLSVSARIPSAFENVLTAWTSTMNA